MANSAVFGGGSVYSSGSLRSVYQRAQMMSDGSGICWPIIDVCSQLRTAMPSSMIFLSFYQANFDKP